MDATLGLPIRSRHQNTFGGCWFFPDMSLVMIIVGEISTAALEPSKRHSYPQRDHCLLIRFS